MPQVDIMKVISITEEALLAQAKLHKRYDESDAKAFSKLYENDIEFRKQWQIVTEAKHSLALAKSIPTMSVTPVSVEVGSTLTSDDSMEAVRQLKALAEKQHRTFEEVFADPANKELAGKTYTGAHRPTVSSPSYREMQRR
jgi:hypothetical protein